MLNILKSHFVFTPLASKSKVLSCGYINCTTLQNHGKKSWLGFLFFVVICGGFLIYKNIIHVQLRISMLVEKNTTISFFFQFNVFLTIGKYRFSDYVTHNLVISRFDGPSLVDFRFNSLNTNSFCTLNINHQNTQRKYLRDFTNHYNFLLFKKNGIYVICSYCFSFKKRECKGALDVVV